MLPMILSFQGGEAFFRNPWTVAFLLLAVGALTVSAIPTYSFKKVKIPNRWILPTMLIVAGLAAFIVSVPWLTMSAIIILYICSIPISYQAHRRLEAKGNPDASVSGT